MKRIPTLDGWRALAISAVVLCHLGECLYPTQSAYEMSIWRYGAFGVDVFFGLSGLLITKLLLAEFERTGSFHLDRFYIRRAFRILPPYLVFLAGYTVAGMWRSGWEVASCLLFFRNYAPDSIAGGGTQHLWSLAVEEHFYLLWPGLLAWVGARRSRDWAARLALLVGLWRLMESQMATPLFPAAFARFRTDLRLDALLWGCAVAFFLNDARQREKLKNQLRFVVWIGMAGLTGLCIRYFSPLTSVIVATLIPMLLAGTVLHPRWLLSRFLDWAPVAWLGRISYSLYLWQGMFLIAAWEHPAAWWRQWPANLVLSVAVAALSHYLVEKPLIRIGARLASRCSAQTRPAQPIPVQDAA
jgi:peptidoglycan/LPS O-acetylase OafA/YrhL